MNGSSQELWQHYYLDPSEANFTDLYEALKGYVYTICYRVLRNDEDDAVDAFQSTFMNLVALAGNRPEAESITDIDTFTRRLAVREADRRRKRRVRRAVREVADEILERVADSRPTADRIASDGEIRTLIERVVDSLPETYRVPVELHYFHGMTHQEIADSLGMARSTVTKVIQKGLHRLEPQLRRAGLGGATAVFGGLLAVAEILRPPSTVAAEALLAKAGVALSTGGSLAAPTVGQVLGHTFSPVSSGIGSVAAVKGIVVAGVAAAVVIAGVTLLPSRHAPPPVPPRPAPVESGAGTVFPNGPGKTSSTGPKTEVPAITGTGISSSGSPDSQASAGHRVVRAGGPGPVSGSGGLPLPLTAADRITTGPRLLVSGVVTFSNGSPAAGARVALIRSGERLSGSSGASETIDAYTTTGLKGVYSLEGVDVSSLRVEAWVDPMTRAQAAIPPPEPVTGSAAGQAPSPASGKERALTRDLVLRTVAAVKGRVVDADGQAIAGALVQAAGTEPDSGPTSWTVETKTDAGGGFLLDLSKQTWRRARVAASAKGYTPEGRVVSIPEDQVFLRLDAAQSSLEGRVFLKSSGEAVAGAVVQAFPVTEASWTEVRLPPLTVRSAADGEFLFPNIPTGRLVLVAEKGDLRTAPRKDPGATRVTLEKGNRREGVSLLLRNSHFLAGTVTDPFGSPIENVRVAARSRFDDLEGATRTDSNGHYRIDELPPAPVTLGFRHDDYEDRAVSGVAIDRKDADFTLDPKGRVTLIGTVLDWETKQPVGGIAVQGEGSVAPVVDPDRAGGFTVANLVPGQTCHLLINAKGYPELDTDPIQVPVGSAEFRQTFELGPGGTITGEVRSIYSKDPLPGVEVVLGAPDGSADGTKGQTAKTDSQGQFRVRGVGKGHWTLEIRPNSPWVPQQVTAAVDFDHVTDLGAINLNRLGTIRGRVVETPGETGLPNQTVELASNFDTQRVRVRTGPDGSFEFKGLKYIYYSVLMLDHQFLDVRVDLDKVDTAEIVVPMGSCTIRGRILWGGRACPRITGVRLLNVTPPSFSRYARADSEGCYTLEGIPAGQWRLEAFPRQPAYQGQKTVAFVNVKPGETLEKDFTLPSGRLTGRVVDGNEEGVGGARIVVRAVKSLLPDVSPPSGSKVLRSLDDGSFQVDDLPPGIYEVGAAEGLRSATETARVEVPFEGDSKPAILEIQPSETGTLVSVALDYTTREGIPSAWCHLKRIAADSRTDGFVPVRESTRGPDGVMSLRDIPAGAYEVEVSAYGYSICHHRVEIQAGKVVTLNDVLYEAGAVRWTLTDPTGKGLPGIGCRLTPKDPTSIEGPHEGVTDAEGQFVVRGLFPGDYVAEATYNGEPVVKTLTVNAHDVTLISTFLPNATATPDRRSAEVLP